MIAAVIGAFIYKLSEFGKHLPERHRAACHTSHPAIGYIHSIYEFRTPFVVVYITNETYPRICYKGPRIAVWLGGNGALRYEQDSQRRSGRPELNKDLRDPGNVPPTRGACPTAPATLRGHADHFPSIGFVVETIAQFRLAGK